ncbi:MAG TPA: MMPL family transporter, partial [Polyangiaceae bacterium]|nr:MMPL family transporter [Polyangiaceae bacterium]
GVSYASLALTDFRGFRQFGFLGGIGMVLSWVLAFVLMPPLAAWVDRRRRLPPLRAAVMPLVVRLVKGHPGVIVAVAAVLAIGAAWRVRSFGPDQIETDFSKLRRADTWKTGEGYWGRKMDALLGSYVTPTVLLADDADEARAIGRVLVDEKKKPPLDGMIASVRTLDDVVPRDQAAKIAVAEDIRDDLTPRIRASLTDAQRRNVDRLLGNGPLVPITASDLPDTFTAGLRERDGTLGRTVLVYPKAGHLLWEGPPLALFVARLRAAAAADVPPGGRPARVAGSLALSNDILESVRRDGILASVAAFAGVVVVVVLLLRGSRATPMVVGSLLLGVLWLAGGMMAMHVKVNFANFIAYPITFGIGVDYAVNMASRWELDGRGSMIDVVRSTGGAVTLCSLTTIIGYSSLLLAQNRALFLFGLLAVLGEVACLVTAVVVLPACLEWWKRRTSH